MQAMVAAFLHAIKRPVIEALASYVTGEETVLGSLRAELEASELDGGARELVLMWANDLVVGFRSSEGTVQLSPYQHCCVYHAPCLLVMYCCQ